MRKNWKKNWLRFRISLRMVQLRLMLLREPEDAMEPEEMLRQIKEKAKERG